MTDEQVQRMLSRIKYKPLWQFALIGGRLEISCSGPNSYNIDSYTTINVPFDIPEDLTEEDFPAWLLERIYGMERHEAREFFTLDGVHIFDPHVELGVL